MIDARCAWSELEAQLVRELGTRIGFGRLMQLAEKEWGDRLESSGLPRGGAHSTGPCVAFLVPCDHNGEEACDWCCGSGRVTARVAAAMKERP